MTRAKHRRTADKKKVMRRWRLAFIIVVAIPLLSGIAMVHANGFRFFVFRASGTGESGDSDLAENQGPGQPDAPGTSRNPFRFVATMPDGTKITLRSTHHDTWAGVAQVRGAHWTIITDGTKFTQVSKQTADWWAVRQARYQTEWVLVPLKEVT